MKAKAKLWLIIVFTILSVVALAGTTCATGMTAVKTDTGSVTAANLDAELYVSDKYTTQGSGVWKSVSKDDMTVIFNESSWEPGYTIVKYFKVCKGDVTNVDFNYYLTLDLNDSYDNVLADVIDVYAFKVSNDAPTLNSHDNVISSATYIDTFSNIAKNNKIVMSDSVTDSDSIFAVIFKMKESAGNDYSNKSLNEFSVTVNIEQVH